MIYNIIASIMMVSAITLFFDLTPERVTDDILQIITPKDSMKERAKNLRGNRKKHKLYRALMKFKTALAATGKSKQFTFVCFASVFLFGAGIIFSILLNNVYLAPVLAFAFGMIPFIYSSNTISTYEKHLKQEMETTLSVITNSYLRSDNIISAVEENLEYIKPPLKSVFQSFLGDATTVSSNIKTALNNLKEKVEDDIFDEWVEVLIQCQDDRTLSDTLITVVAKLTDVRVVNNELKTMLQNARNEYWTMVLLVVGNIPLLYFLNKDWYHTLMFTTAGKIVLGICGAVILVTALLMLKFTKPISYKR